MTPVRRIWGHQRTPNRLPTQHFLACFVACVLCSTSAVAAASDPWVAIDSEVRCKLNDRTGEECLIEESTLILDDRARANLGTRSLVFPETHSLVLESAYTETPDGQRIEVATDEIQTGTAQGDGNGFLSARFIKLAFREVQVGSQLHLRYRSKSPVVEPFNHLSKIFRGTSGAARWDRLRYVAEANVPLQVKAENADLFQITRSEDGLTVVVESVRPIYIPPSRLGPDFSIRDLARIDLSSTRSWQEFLAPVAQGFSDRLGSPLPAPMRKLVNRIQGQSETEKAREILEYVGEKLRYLGDWRESVHGYLPFTLEEISQRGFGDCKDLALVTVAMLHATGIDAQVALIRASADDSLPLLPNLQYLNHAIVRARIGGREVWLDPTLSANSLAAPPAAEQNRKAFILESPDKVKEGWIPLQDLAANRTLQLVDLTPEGKQWKVDARITREGIEAIGLSFSSLSDNERDERELREILPGSVTLLDKEVQREKVQERLVDHQVIKISAHVNRLTKTIGSYQLYDPGYLGNTLAALRSFQVNPGREDFQQYVSAHSRVVRIHRTSALEPVQSCSVKSPWIDLSVTPLELNGGVGYQVVLAKKTPWILASEMKQRSFRDFIDQLEDCANNLRTLLK